MALDETVVCTAAGVAASSLEPASRDAAGVRVAVTMVRGFAVPNEIAGFCGAAASVAVSTGVDVARLVAPTGMPGVGGVLGVAALIALNEPVGVDDAMRGARDSSGTAVGAFNEWEETDEVADATAAMVEATGDEVASVADARGAVGDVADSTAAPLGALFALNKPVNLYGAEDSIAGSAGAVIDPLVALNEDCGVRSASGESIGACGAASAVSESTGASVGGLVRLDEPLGAVDWNESAAIEGEVDPVASSTDAGICAPAALNDIVLACAATGAVACSAGAEVRAPAALDAFTGAPGAADTIADGAGPTGAVAPIPPGVSFAAAVARNDLAVSRAPNDAPAASAMLNDDVDASVAAAGIGAVALNATALAGRAVGANAGAIVASGCVDDSRVADPATVAAGVVAHDGGAASAGVENVMPAHAPVSSLDAALECLDVVGLAESFRVEGLDFKEDAANELAGFCAEPAGPFWLDAGARHSFILGSSVGRAGACSPPMMLCVCPAAATLRSSMLAGAPACSGNASVRAPGTDAGIVAVSCGAASF